MQQVIKLHTKETSSARLPLNSSSVVRCQLFPFRVRKQFRSRNGVSIRSRNPGEICGNFGSSVNTYELGHEGNHQVEKTNGFDESETQNSVGEELATESRVAGNTVEEGSEDETNTDTSTSQTNGGGTHTDVLGNLNESLSDLGRVGTALDGVAGSGVEDGGSLLAAESLHGAGSAFIGCVSCCPVQLAKPEGSWKPSVGSIGA